MVVAPVVCEAPSCYVAQSGRACPLSFLCGTVKSRTLKWLHLPFALYPVPGLFC